MKNLALYYLVILFAVTSCVPGLNQIKPITTSRPTATPTLVPVPYTYTNFLPRTERYSFWQSRYFMARVQASLSQNHTVEECLGVTRTNWKDVGEKPSQSLSLHQTEWRLVNVYWCGDDVYEAVHKLYREVLLRSRGESLNSGYIKWRILVVHENRCRSIPPPTSL